MCGVRPFEDTNRESIDRVRTKLFEVNLNREHVAKFGYKFLNRHYKKVLHARANHH